MLNLSYENTNTLVLFLYFVISTKVTLYNIGRVISYNVSYLLPKLKNPIGQSVYECNING